MPPAAATGVATWVDAVLAGIMVAAAIIVSANAVAFFIRRPPASINLSDRL